MYVMNVLILKWQFGLLSERYWAYTLEEPPYFRTENMGSAQHARRLKEQGH